MLLLQGMAALQQHGSKRLPVTGLDIWVLNDTPEFPQGLFLQLHPQMALWD